MGAPKTYPVTKNYKVGRGRTKIQRYNDLGVLQQRANWLGNNPAFTLSVESENLQHFSSEGGVREVDADIPLSITRTSQIRVDNISPENLALFLSGSLATVAQTAGSVTGEILSGIAPSSVFQLGETAGNIAGVRLVSAVTPSIVGAARANDTAYARGDVYQPATPNDHLYICTVAGTSASSPPTFTTDGTDFSDGTATFLDLGVVTGLVADTDYIVDTDHAFVSIPADGKLAAAYNAAIAGGFADNELGELALSVNYTKTACNRIEINAGNTAAVRCKVVFKANNAFGDNDDVVIEDCTLRPSGEFAMITEDGFAEMTFDVGINIRDQNTPPVKYVKPAVAA